MRLSQSSPIMTIGKLYRDGVIAQRIMIVTSASNPIAKMQVTFAPYRSHASYLELLPSDEQSYTLRDYKFYDKDGVLLEE